MEYIIRSDESGSTKVGELTRCRDCKYNYGLVSGGDYNPEDIVCSCHMSDGFTESDYCSYAERKNNGRD